MRISHRLTFASLDAFLPRMIKPRVAFIPTVLVPGTIKRAAAEFAGFGLGATLRTDAFRRMSNGGNRRSMQGGSGFRSRVSFCRGDIWGILAQAKVKHTDKLVMLASNHDMVAMHELTCAGADAF